MTANFVEHFWRNAATAGNFVRRFWFPVLWSFIGFVSAIDSYFVIRFRELMADMEQNPIGSYLIQLDDGHVGVFLRTKAAGTIAVLTVLAVLYLARHRWAGPIVGSVALFQFGLLYYLTMTIPYHPVGHCPAVDMVVESAPASAAEQEGAAGHRGIQVRRGLNVPISP